MTSEISGFFYDATSAKYDTLTWQRPYRGIIGNGIVKNPPSDLGVNTGAVTALGSPNMSVNVDTMQAWMQGFWYRNPAVINLTITAAHPSLPRIDRVVLTLSVTGTAPYYAGSITVSVITGTPAASPVADVGHPVADVMPSIPALFTNPVGPRSFTITTVKLYWNGRDTAPAATAA